LFSAFTFTALGDTGVLFNIANGTPDTANRFDLVLDDRGPCIADNTVLATSSSTILHNQLIYVLTFQEPEYEFPYDETECSEGDVEYEIYMTPSGGATDFSPAHAFFDENNKRIALLTTHPTGDFDYFVYMTPFDAVDYSTNFQSFSITIYPNRAPSFSQPQNYQIKNG